MSEEETLCCKCKIAIKVGTIVTALERKWHPECFKCTKCEKVIDGKFNTPTASVDPYCAECYNEVFSPKCKKCSLFISNEKYVTYEKDCYHRACFNCGICGDSLVEKSFIIKDENPACAKHA